MVGLMSAGYHRRRKVFFVGTIPSMTITLKLDEEQSRRLVEVAHELKVDPSELAKAAISDLVRAKQ